MFRTPFPLWTVLAPLALTLLWLGAVAWYESRVGDVGVRGHLSAAAVGSAIVFGAAYLLQAEFLFYPWYLTDQEVKFWLLAAALAPYGYVVGRRAGRPRRRWLAVTGCLLATAAFPVVWQFQSIDFLVSLFRDPPRRSIGYLPRGLAHVGVGVVAFWFAIPAYAVGRAVEGTVRDLPWRRYAAGLVLGVIAYFPRVIVADSPAERFSFWVMLGTVLATGALTVWLYTLGKIAVSLPYRVGRTRA